MLITYVAIFSSGQFGIVVQWWDVLELLEAGYKSGRNLRATPAGVLAFADSTDDFGLACCLLVAGQMADGRWQKSQISFHPRILTMELRDLR